MSGSLSFCLLGPIEVRAGDRRLAVGGPRQQMALAMLLLERGRVVSADRLVEALWGEQAPSTARSQVYNSVSSLRRTFTEIGSPDLIGTRSAGYVLDAASGRVDVEDFHQLVVRGRAAVRANEPVRAVADFRSALKLWRGPAMADVDSRRLQSAAARLNEERVTVVEECVGLELAVGRHDAVVGELSELVDAHPLREKLWAHLMLALYRSGRQGEALSAYRRATEVLAEELGLDPCDELQALQRAILGKDSSLDVPAAPSESAAADRSRLAVPQQLPAAIPDFVGRAETVQRIRAHLTPGACRAGGGRRHVETVVVGGRSGVGKSALALHAAHEVREHYPDGQLFAHLGTAEARAAQPARVLERFLRALGVAPALLPEGLEDLAALYRSELAGRRILVVLDDAATQEQVLPFVPGDPGSALLVTSWRPLPGLHGLHRVDLDTFTPLTSAALLCEVMGEDRVRAEPEAAAALAVACDHLPLALRVAAAKLSARGHWSIQQMVARLKDEGRRLDELTLGDVGVRSSIALSYAGLGERAATLLLLLATLGHADFAHWVAAPLLDADVADSDDVLDELVQARLVEAQVDVDGAVRFHLHDLVRIFANETGGRQAPDRESQRRLLRCWLFLASEARRREYGDDFTMLHSHAPSWALPRGAMSSLLAEPLAWFQTEQANLVTAIARAAQYEQDDLCWDLTLTAAEFFESLYDLEAAKATNDIALRAVRLSHNQRGEAAMLFLRGGLAMVAERFDDARRDLLRARAWFDGVGDEHGRGLALSDLASVDSFVGRYERAMSQARLALADLRVAADRAGEAHVLDTMAKIWLRRGRLVQAETLICQALGACPAGARRVTAQLTYRRGEILRMRGMLAEAEVAFNHVLQVVTELNDPVGRFFALLGLGRVQAARKELALAENTLQTALGISLKIGERVGRCTVLLVLAELALERGDIASASARMTEYDAITSELGAVGTPTEYAEMRKRLSAAPDITRV